MQFVVDLLSQNEPSSPFLRLCGVSNSRSNNPLRSNFGVSGKPGTVHLPLFDDLYDEFPAHLHINVHARTRGRGVGADLLRAFEEAVFPAPGVHLVTTAGARNASFNRRNAYTYEVERSLPGGADSSQPSLLFMGKRLDGKAESSARRS